MPTPDSAVRRYDARRRRARMAGYGVAVLLWLFGMVLAAGLKESGQNDTVNDVMQLLAQSFWVGGPVLGYVVYARMARPKGLLLWCRRFDASYAEGVRFHRALGQASPAMVYPITVQDQKFQASLLSAAVRRAALFPFVLAIWVAGMLLLLGFVALSLGDMPPIWVLLFVLLAWTVVLAWATMKVLRASGVVALNRDEASAHFAAARDGARLPGIGVEVVKCPYVGDDWRHVVFTALEQSDVALVDVSALMESPPLQWELGAAIHVLGVRRVLLARADDVAGTPDLIHEILTIAARSGQTDPAWLSNAWFEYPARQAPVGPGRRKQYAELTKRLRSAIAAVVAQPGAVAETTSPLKSVAYQR